MALAAWVTMVLKSGAEEEFLAAAADVLRDVRTEPGNLMAVLLRDPHQSGQIIALEIYRDEAAITAHKQAAHSLDKGPTVRALLDRQPDARWFETLGWPE